MFSLYMKFDKNQKQLEKNRRFKSFFHEIGQNLPFFEKKINYPLAVESCFAYNYERTSHVFLDEGVPDESEVPLCRLPPEIQF